MCGASVVDTSPNCSHCGTRLALVACPSCFGMVFEGANFCPHCGGAVSRSAEGSSDLGCPRCEKTKLERVRLGETLVDECAECHGLWIQAEVFQRICADQEKQSAILGSSTTPRPERAF